MSLYCALLTTNFICESRATFLTGDVPYIVAKNLSTGSCDVGILPLVAGANVTIATNASGVTISSAGAAGVADGDKGDIVVSGAGTVWTVDTGVITTTKMGGDVTAAGKSLLDDASAAAQRTTLDVSQKWVGDIFLALNFS